MIDDLLKAISETFEGYFRKIAVKADPSILREFIKKLLLGIFLLLPALCGIILFATMPNLGTVACMSLGIFFNFPWVVFWLDVKEAYERLQIQQTTKKELPT